MLEVDRVEGNLEPWLSKLECCAAPPSGEREFLSKTGLMPIDGEDRRRYARYYFRRKAVVKTLPTLPAFGRAENIACVYIRDISKQGVGFLYPEQLYPSERCVLFLPELGHRLVEVSSCRRLAAGCFAIGTRFQGRVENQE